MTRRALLFHSLTAALVRGQTSEAIALLRQATASGDVAAATLLVRHGKEEITKAFGKARGPNEVFLLASITKPMTAAGVMKLVDRKIIRLEDPVRRFLPEFTGGERDNVTLRHLLTHTSGLPDMLPENEELRKRHAPLRDFVAGACRTPLLFSPGAEVRYQSMGILLAAEIAERVTRTPFRDFLRREIFRPLGMSATSLGLGGRVIADTARCQVPAVSNWDWNSSYWRELGAPWGGAHAPCADVAKFLEAFVRPTGKPLLAATAARMVSDQNRGLNKPWGIGFMLGPEAFGSGCGPRTFGHSGSTGTLCWADPDKNLTFVLLTTKPAELSRTGLLIPVSERISQIHKGTD